MRALLQSSAVPSAVLALALCAASAVQADNSSTFGHRLDGDDAIKDQIKRGFELVPAGVKLNLAGRNRALIGLGSYIVNTSGCVDCHTHPSYAPGGDPFKGEPEQVNAAQYMSGGRTFGPFKAPNLTPDAVGKPAGLTFEQFRRALRTGRDPDDPNVILQVMPWPVYGKKTDLELLAMYEFFRAIPSLPDNPNPGP